MPPRSQAKGRQGWTARAPVESPVNQGAPLLASAWPCSSLAARPELAPLAPAGGCASSSAPGRLLRGRHAAPRAVLPRLGLAWSGLAWRGVRSWPAPALAGSGCRANTATLRLGGSEAGALPSGSALCPAQASGASRRRLTSYMRPAAKGTPRSGSIGVASHKGQLQNPAWVVRKLGHCLGQCPMPGPGLFGVCSQH